jgi:6-phosphogluconolactonase
LVTEVYVAEERLHRLALTAAVINQAALVVFLVSGQGKALILQKVPEGGQDPLIIPALLIKPVNGQLLWLVSRDAARLL